MSFFRIVPRASSAVLICLLFLSFLNPGLGLAQTTDDSVLPDGTKSDGCTLITDGPYRACCVAHDREYFYGGSEKERRESDNRLYECIRKTHGTASKLKAVFIWLGVRIGGVSFLPTPFRWGFGNKKKPGANQVENGTSESQTGVAPQPPSN